MRTYKIMKQRALAFDADPEVRGILAEQKDAELAPLLTGAYSGDRAAALRALNLDIEPIAARGLGYERLDQLLIEYLTGVRS